LGRLKSKFRGELAEQVEELEYEPDCTDRPSYDDCTNPLICAAAED